MNTKGNAGEPATGVSNDVFADFNWESDAGVTVVTPEATDPDDDDELEPGTVVTKAKPAKAKKEDEENESDLANIFEEFTDDDEEPVIPAKVKPATKATVKVEKTEAGTEGNNPDDSEDDDEDDTKFYTTLATEMKDKGIFSSVELKKDEKITEDKFFELQETEVETRAEEMVGALIEELKEDPDAAALIKFVKNGGSSRDFFKTYGAAPSNKFPEDYDLSKPANQEKFLRYYLEVNEDMDADEIDEKLEWYAEKGKTEDFATKFHAKQVAKDNKAKSELLKAQAKAVEKSKEDQEAFRSKLQTTLNETDAIGDFTFTAAEKKELVPFMTKATIKVGDNYVTPFHAKMQEIMKDPKQLLLLLKNVKNGFNTKDLKKTTKTEVVEKVKGSLRAAKTEKTLTNRGRSQSLSFADRFDD